MKSKASVQVTPVKRIKAGIIPVSRFSQRIILPCYFYVVTIPYVQLPLHLATNVCNNSFLTRTSRVVDHVNAYVVVSPPAKYANFFAGGQCRYSYINCISPWPFVV